MRDKVIEKIIKQNQKEQMKELRMLLGEQEEGRNRAERRRNKRRTNAKSNNNRQ